MSNFDSDDSFIAGGKLLVQPGVGMSSNCKESLLNTRNQIPNRWL